MALPFCDLLCFLSILCWLPVFPDTLPPSRGALSDTQTPSQVRTRLFTRTHTVLWLRLLCPGPVASEGTSLLGSWGGVQEQKQLCSSLCESYKFKMRTDKA